jgi:acetylornithine deacetylase/succinyl-diaminopimelate desuccinylase-like protein
MAKSKPSPVYERPAELLRRLIQFDTTNPPGNEAECVSFINGLLTEAGIQTTILGRSSERPNLIARLSGRGAGPPLMLYGHVDVVTTEGQNWQHPPFDGEVIDGFVWGRGALDMKGGVAMMLAAFLRAKGEGLALPGDVVLAIVSDEEAGGDFGAKYLVENHAALFDGVRYAIGEFGGFSFYLAKRRFYPIMIAEKQICAIAAIVHGPGGHGSLPVRGGAMAGLSRFLRQLDRHRLPVHVTPVARLMIKALASATGGVTGLILVQLANPALSNSVLATMGERSRVFEPILHNTVSPTILRASEKINVIPSEVSVGLDCRLLPEIARYDPGPAEPDMGMFGLLAEIMRQADPDGIPIPLLLPAVTDGRFFSQLGIQTYGFLPMALPENFNFTQTIHAADERIPVESLGFGSDAIYQLLQRFGG